MTISAKKQTSPRISFDHGISARIHEMINKRRKKNKVSLRTIQRILSGATKKDKYGVIDLAIEIQSERNKKILRLRNEATLIKNLNP